MPLIEVNGSNPVVSVNENQLVIQSFILGNVEMPQREWDLTGFQGHKPRVVRFYAGEDGEYHINDGQAVFWQVAEANLPGVRYESVPTGRKDENGQDIMEQVVVIPNLEQEAEIRVWALLEQGGN